jgi:adenosylcobinamide kinase / adenosylcobinamide-phosphate guanylyltransferase
VSRLVLILGGARSGKSTLAERMAAEGGGRVTFIATAEAGDGEMARRIEAHRAARPPGWRTLEEPLELPGAVAAAVAESDVLVLDCLTVWVSNHLCRIVAEESSPEWTRAVEALPPALEAQLIELVGAIRAAGATALVVSNEVGLGLVPATPLGRAYRDLLGFVNRRVAEEADQVLLMVAGLAVDVKRLSEELR